MLITMYVAYRGVPTRVSLPSQAVQVAAGSNHTVILLANGQVLTCGNFQVKGDDSDDLIQYSLLWCLGTLEVFGLIHI